MTDANRPDEDPSFEETVAADRAREQGLGLGARELAAQRDPGGVVTPDEDAEVADGVSINAGDGEALDESLAVQGEETVSNQG